MTEANNHPIMPYGVPIQDAIASGDLAKMKEMVTRTEEWLASQEKLRSLLDQLKAEIAVLDK
jgi:hypothetical protein